MAFYNGSGLGVIAGVADSGVASDFMDLFTTVRDAAVAEGWTVLIDSVYSGSDRKWMLRGPGTTPGVQPYVGAFTVRDVPSDYYNWKVFCMTGYNAADTGISTQPGANNLLYDLNVLMWNDPIPYYLMINNRRIHCVINVDGVWQHWYQGFFLPYATPDQYPYPMLVSASISSPGVRYSTTTADFRNGIAHAESENAQIWDPYGAQRIFGNGATEVRMAPEQDPSFNYEGEAPPYTTDPTHLDFANARPCHNQPDEFHLTPFIIYKPYRYIAGEVDGVYKCAGFSNSAGDLVTIGGKTYLMVQDHYRTGFGDYFAVLLE